MFRVLLFLTATFLLMAAIESGRVLLGMRERTPQWWDWVAFVAAAALTLLLVTVLIYLQYRTDKESGTVVRKVALFERALAVAERLKAERGPRKEKDS